jgi:hypothetical protein
MKIAYVITLMDDLGGVQVHVRDLPLGLKAGGHEPVIQTQDSGNSPRSGVWFSYL